MSPSSASTITGNTADDVGGGIRSLGNFTIVNSTISGNTSTGWMGGGFFHTDGVMNIVNSTIANNTAPIDTTGGGFVGTFTSANATLTLANTIFAGNSGSQVFRPLGWRCRPADLARPQRRHRRQLRRPGPRRYRPYRC